MTPDESTKVRKSFSYWFRRALIALILGLLTWYTVGHLLSPKPEWTLTLKGSTINGRILGKNDHQEWLFEAESTSEPALLVDMKAGVVQKRLLGFKEFSNYSKSCDTDAILYGRTAWCFQEDKSHVPTEIKLFAIENDQVADRRCIRKWTLTDPDRLKITWGPIGTGLFLVQSLMPQELFTITAISPFGFSLPWNALLPEEQLDGGAQALFQVWQLPKTASEDLQLVSSWTFDSYGRHDYVSFSPDGTQLAIADEGEHHICGVLMMDVKTGRLMQSLKTEKRVRLSEFRGPYLFCKVVDLYPAYWVNMEEKQLPIAVGLPVLDVKKGIPLKLPDSFSQSADMGTRLEVHPLQPDWMYIKTQAKIVSDAVSFEYTILKRMDDHFVVQSQFTKPKRTYLEWVGQGHLFAAWRTYDPPPSFLSKLAERHAWLQTIVDKIWTTERLKTVVYESTGDVVWQFEDAKYVNTISQRGEGDINIDPTRMVLARGMKGNNSYSRIESYKLPISFPSSRWPIISGVLTAVVVFSALLWRSLR